MKFLIWPQTDLNLEIDMKKIILFFLATLSVNTYSSAFVQTNVEIDRLGSHQGQVFYLNLKEPFKTDCTGSHLYCPLSNENCKNYYSLILATKIAGKKLMEIDYTQDPVSKYCTVILVQVN